MVNSATIGPVLGRKADERGVMREAVLQRLALERIGGIGVADVFERADPQQKRNDKRSNTQPA